MAELMVRMAEMAVASRAEDVLVSLGLGSCIGLALIDESRRVAGMAHIVLPESSGSARAEVAGKFADTAVPALAADVRRRAGAGARLKAVLAGGAQMFSFSSPSASGRLDIGLRNAAATHAALEALRIPVAAAAVGGSTGRTIRLHLASWTVTVKEAGGVEQVLFELGGAPVRRAAA
jgi:chemotaxis protein CheD